TSRGYHQRHQQQGGSRMPHRIRTFARNSTVHRSCHGRDGLRALVLCASLPIRAKREAREGSSEASPTLSDSRKDRSTDRSRSGGRSRLQKIIWIVDCSANSFQGRPKSRMVSQRRPHENSSRFRKAVVFAS